MEKAKPMKTNAAQDQMSIAEKEVEVLYQKLGDRWFAFSLVDDEIFYGSIGQDDLKRPTIPTHSKRSS